MELLALEWKPPHQTSLGSRGPKAAEVPVQMHGGLGAPIEGVRHTPRWRGPQSSRSSGRPRLNAAEAPFPKP